MATDHPAPTDRTSPDEPGDDHRYEYDFDPLPTDLVPVDDPTALPAPDSTEPRPYIEIRPTETEVDPSTVTRAMALIERLLREKTQTGLKHKLRGTTVRPVIEWLLVSDGRPDPSIRYLIGSNVPEIIEDVAGICRTCFPNSYELSHVWWHPRYVEASLPTVPVDSTDERPLQNSPKRNHPNHPAITPDSPYVAGVKYLGRARRKLDWQTPLTPFDAFAGGHRHTNRATSQRESRRIPLAALVETVCDAELPLVYQVVAHPYEDWTGLADSYLSDLSEGTVSYGDHVWEFLSPRDRDAKNRYNPSPADEERIEGIAARDPARTLLVSARAVVLTRDAPARADAVARRLVTNLAHLSGRHHEIVGAVVTDDEWYDGNGATPDTKLYEDLCGRTVYPAGYSRLGDWLRRRPHESRGIVTAIDELPGFCVLDGAGLTPNGRRALDTRPNEQTGLSLPPPEQLARYNPPGMALGMPLTHDREPLGRPLVLPPSLQDRHVIVAGDTGSGKSVLVETAMLTNVEATDGPSILFDLKGGDTAAEYCRAHYAAYGTLDDVLYFDCTRVLPALSFFDIRPLLAADIPREEARSRKAGHYEEIVRGVMGGEPYDRAIESPKLIRNHLRALFDPIHGNDAVRHADLYRPLRHTLGQQETPPVADDALADYFTSLLDRDRDVFNRAVGGAVSRVETIASDGRLAPLFDHVPGEGDPHLDFSTLIEEDRVCIFDFGGMEAAAKRALTLAILSSLWTALRARHERANRGDAEADAEAADTATSSDAPPLVNCYLEDAKDVAETALVDTLLAQGRAFGCSVTLDVQYPQQIETRETDTYRELLNETATFVVGNVAVDDDLAKVFATDELRPNQVATRLARLPRGEWLLRPGADFGEPTPRPFLARSLPAPRGHPASTEAYSPDEEAAFLAAFENMAEHTAAQYGLAQTELTAASASADTDEADDDPEPALGRVDSLLPYTERLPSPIRYDAQSHSIHCRACGNRYDPSLPGIRRGIECCHALDDVDRDDIPPSEITLKLSPEERRASAYTDRQLLFVQLVYLATQRRLDPLEFDLIEDSMFRLHEYVGIDADEVEELIHDGLLRRDTDHPHRLYSVTADGWRAIGESPREGLDFGHGQGDLGESAQHARGVAIGERLAAHRFADDPDSAAVTVSAYHQIDEGRRLDVAALDENGDVVATIEVERINNDAYEAIPADFDKMADCDPEEAIWIVMTLDAGHDVLAALNDPPDGEPRVEKTYSRSTPTYQFTLDAPGCSAIYPVEYVRKTLLENESGT